MKLTFGFMGALIIKIVEFEWTIISLLKEVIGLLRALQDRVT